MPDRIQRRRDRGWRLPDNAVIVARPSRWGNPYWVGSWRDPYNLDAGRVETVEEAVELFRLNTAPWLDLGPLRGKDLACYCPPDQVCHADVLLSLANRPEGAP